MSDIIENNNFLEEIQKELDVKYIEYAKKEFQLKLEHFNHIKPLCEKRDNFLKEHPDLFLNFWEQAFQNYDFGQELLPADFENKYDSKWIKCLKVEYLDNYFCSVKIEVNDNEYVENLVLEKKFSLENQDVEGTKVIWKSNNKCPLISFFETEEEEFEVFDYLYELYINAYFYYALQDEE